MGPSPFPAQSRQGKPCKNPWTGSSRGFSPIPAAGTSSSPTRKTPTWRTASPPPGRSPEHHAQEGRFRSLDQYRRVDPQNVPQGLVDIMLMSGGTNEVPTNPARPLIHGTAATLAVRANDATDVGRPKGAPIWSSVRAVPLGVDRPGDVRQAPLRAQRAKVRRRSGPPRSPSTTTRCRTIARWRRTGCSARRRPPRTSATSWKFSIPSAANAHPRPGPVHQRHDRAGAWRAWRARRGRCSSRSSTMAPPPWNNWPATIPGSSSASSRRSASTCYAFQQLWEGEEYDARVALDGGMINHLPSTS